MSRHELLIGSAAFWTRAAADIVAARRRVLVQAMTFEGDTAGGTVAAALAAATARGRRLLVDAYSLHVTNDRLLPLAPWQPKALRAEQRATRALFDQLVRVGVGVRITNPVGRNPLRFPLRNHKKLLVMDDIAYIGGINVSDHNFAWHDLMLRIEDPAVADFLATDFRRDWSGRPAGEARSFQSLDLVTLAGQGNETALQPIVEMFAAARRSIEMIGAYPTLPFTEAMARAASAGCEVTIYTPEANNKPLLRDSLFDLAGRAPVRLALLPEMTHAKAVLVDGERVLFGSVNFNLASWRSNSDLLAVSADPALVAAFEVELFAPVRASSRPARLAAVSPARRRQAGLLLGLGDRILARLPYGPVRAVDWKPLSSPNSAEPKSACSSVPPARSR